MSRTLKFVGGPKRGATITEEHPPSILRYPEGEYKLVSRGGELFYLWAKRKVINRKP